MSVLPTQPLPARAAYTSEYWIINLIERQVEAYGDPDPAAHPEPQYRRRAVYGAGAQVPFVLGHAAVGDVSTDSLLPPA